MKIMFDVDGVLADFVLGYTILAKKMGIMDTATNTHQQLEWDSLDNDKVWDKINNALPNFFETLKPLIPLETFNSIRMLSWNNDIYFVTSRKATDAKHQTEVWLSSWGITNPTVIISKYKGDFARAVGIDYSIEDKLENAYCIGILSPTTKSYLIDRPYNASVIHTKKVIRIDTVDEYIRRILQ